MSLCSVGTDEVRIGRLAVSGGIGESLIGEGLQLVDARELMLQDIPHHGTTARFGPDGLHLQLPQFPNNPRISYSYKQLQRVLDLLFCYFLMGEQHHESVLP